MKSKLKLDETKCRKDENDCKSSLVSQSLILCLLNEFQIICTRCMQIKSQMCNMHFEYSKTEWSSHKNIFIFLLDCSKSVIHVANIFYNNVNN